MGVAVVSAVVWEAVVVAFVVVAGVLVVVVAAVVSGLVMMMVDAVVARPREKVRTPYIDRLQQRLLPHLLRLSI